MRKVSPSPIVIAALLASTAHVQTASAQGVPELADLVGARGAGGETQLQARGYEATNSSTVGDQRYTFWWNQRKGQCVSVATMEGRYSAIQPVPAGNCDKVASTAPAYGHGQPQPSDPGSLVLVCYGAGTKLATTPPTYKWNPFSHKWEWGSSGLTTQGFGSDVQIELYGDHGRIHLGKSLVPPIHSGGDNGWWEITNLQSSPTMISGTYRLNGMNKPTFTVDRRTGSIEVKGMTKFSGHCDVGNWNQGQARF
ncbi:MAG: hypothetical protein B7X90_17130 [Novosphingobium sp. 17-62-19]|uniref:hypothetical protein n=1 Tax=Novosphingobium sp. 17-62-19 TaxID=1970406 RepID=UPI000BD3A054|nr:hypothetical protein [Novosphingobium sp. 17-62-19]OYX93277.1 MAG: hypothetical protein B7Y74_10065 [Novosphingobium sp. 35-62-5]OZA16813.1 MAG: hypothetical protein B7X90_17130 [Novosphingobium sp. 17-62-19]